MIWIALFSNSGSELASINEKLGRYPDVMLCDKKRTEWHPGIIRQASVQDHATIMRIIRTMPDNVLVTLHGYLRIIPADAIKPNMYNVHPGDIEMYPALKGIHPQRKALEFNLATTGVVIHKVVEGVDDGPIVRSAKYTIQDGETEASLISNLRDLSIDLWVDFLKDKV